MPELCQTSSPRRFWLTSLHVQVWMLGSSRDKGYCQVAHAWMLGRLTQKKPHWPQLVELVSRSAHTPLQHTSLAMGHWYAQNPQLRPHPNETHLSEPRALTCKDS